MQSLPRQQSASTLSTRKAIRLATTHELVNTFERISRNSGVDIISFFEPSEPIASAHSDIHFCALVLEAGFFGLGAGASSSSAADFFDLRGFFFGGAASSSCSLLSSSSTSSTCCFLALRALFFGGASPSASALVLVLLAALVRGLVAGASSSPSS